MSEQPKWRDLQVDPPPQDGKPFWAWLHNSGIRKMRWETAEEYVDRTGKTEEPEEFEAAFVEAEFPHEDWSPAWWLPYDAIPEPPA